VSRGQGIPFRLERRSLGRAQFRDRGKRPVRGSSTSMPMSACVRGIAVPCAGRSACRERSPRRSDSVRGPAIPPIATARSIAAIRDRVLRALFTRACFPPSGVSSPPRRAPLCSIPASPSTMSAMMPPGRTSPSAIFVCWRGRRKAIRSGFTFGGTRDRSIAILAGSTKPRPAGAAALHSRARGPRYSDDCLCHIALIKLELASGGDAAELIVEGRRLRPDNHLLQWFEAKSLMRRGHFGDAGAIFTAFARIDPETLVAESAHHKRLFGAGAAYLAAECGFRAGDYAEAVRWYGVAEAATDGAAEYRCKRQLAEIRSRRVGLLR
jgi:hypothetical protein